MDDQYDSLGLGKTLLATYRLPGTTVVGGKEKHVFLFNEQDLREDRLLF